MEFVGGNTFISQQSCRRDNVCPSQPSEMGRCIDPTGLTLNGTNRVEHMSAPKAKPHRTSTDKSKKACSDFSSSSSVCSSEASDAVGRVPATVEGAVKVEPEDADRFKTELCRSWEELGRCKYGLRCKFAHGCQELRPLDRHPRYKTTPCRQFHTRGFCSYGSRCHFIHGETDRLLLAFLLTAVQLEKAKQNNSKSATKDGNYDKRSGHNKGQADKNANKPSDTRVSSSAIKTSKQHKLNSKPARSNEFNQNAPRVTSHFQQVCTKSKGVDHFPEKILNGDSFGVRTFLDKAGTSGQDGRCGESKSFSAPFRGMPHEIITGRQVFSWPMQPRSRTSSGESYEDDLDLPSGNCRPEIANDQNLNGIEECLNRRHHFITCQRQILEERLLETLRQIKELKMESSTLDAGFLLSKLHSDVDGRANSGADQRTFMEVAPQLPRSSVLAGSAMPSFYDGLSRLGSSHLSNSPPGIHWFDISEGFDRDQRCLLVPQN